MLLGLLFALIQRPLHYVDYRVLGSRTYRVAETGAGWAPGVMMEVWVEESDAGEQLGKGPVELRYAGGRESCGDKGVVVAVDKSTEFGLVCVTRIVDGLACNKTLTHVRVVRTIASQTAEYVKGRLTLWAK